MSDIQIGQLSQVNSIVDSMQFPTETANVTQKIYATTLRDYVSSLPYLTAAGNVTAANLVTSGNLYAGNIIAVSKLYGNLSTATQLAITQLGTLSTLAVSANITAGNLSANTSGTKSIFTEIHGTVQTSAQPNITSLGILTSLNAGSSGNLVAASSAPSTSSTTGALVVVGGTGVGGNLNVGGDIGATGEVNVTGVLRAPTAGILTANTQVATTAFVAAYQLTKANIDSQTFTGTPSLPTGTTAITQSAGDNTTKLATTAFVYEANVGLASSIATLLASKSSLSSPTFTGTPSLPTGTTAITQSAGDNTTKLATTAFVYEANVGLANNIGAQLNLKAPLASPTFTGTVSGITKSMIGLSEVNNTSDTNKPISSATQSALDLKANLDSPTFTGNVVLPSTATGVTQAVNDSSTKLATTQFVASSLLKVPAGSIVMWPTSSPPTGYLLLDGSAISRTIYSALFNILGISFGTGDGISTFNLPNYTNRVPIGAGSLYASGATGGSKDAVIVSHSHTATVTVSDPGHFHSTVQMIGDNNVDGVDSTTTRSGDHHNQARNTGSASTGITVSVSNDTTGVSGTNANLPPYIGTYFIIKT